MSAKLDDELRIIGQCLRLLDPLSPVQRSSAVSYLQQRTNVALYNNAPIFTVPTVWQGSAGTTLPAPVNGGE